MIEFRKAGWEDRGLLFRWRNDPLTRRYSLNPEPLVEAEHNQWFAASMENERRILLLACVDGTVVGVLRLDLVDESLRTAEVSIYVDPERHGQGLGKEVLQGAAIWVEKNTSIERLQAKVVQDNGPSVRIFKGCGFREKYVFFEKEVSRT
ncbi:MAG: GNAT family N-acetyltransferase [Deltaproteobacteria bacterium]|nr:GNAT family N-acetyltransferase [Deltaproteobacteria bacterium]